MIFILEIFIKKNRYYSGWGEDVFIYKFFVYSKNGFYFDIGSYHPIKYSNTCLLHKQGWKGVNIDVNQTSIDLFNIAERPKDKKIYAKNAIFDTSDYANYFIDHSLLHW